MNADRHNWACDLSQLYAEVWASLMRGVHDRHAPARHSTLATVSTDGRPQARTVVLRAANKMAGTLDIHTDLHSAKVKELRVTPFAALHVWDASAHLQLRLEAHVTLFDWSRSGRNLGKCARSVAIVLRQRPGSGPAHRKSAGLHKRCRSSVLCHLTPRCGNSRRLESWPATSTCSI